MPEKIINAIRNSERGALALVKLSSVTAGGSHSKSMGNAQLYALNLVYNRYGGSVERFVNEFPDEFDRNPVDFAVGYGRAQLGL